MVLYSEKARVSVEPTAAPRMPWTLREAAILEGVT